MGEIRTVTGHEHIWKSVFEELDILGRHEPVILASEQCHWGPYLGHIHFGGLFTPVLFHIQIRIHVVKKPGSLSQMQLRVVSDVFQTRPGQGVGKINRNPGSVQMFVAAVSTELVVNESAHMSEGGRTKESSGATHEIRRKRQESSVVEIRAKVFDRFQKFHHVAPNVLQSDERRQHVSLFNFALKFRVLRHLGETDQRSLRQQGCLFNQTIPVIRAKH